MNKRIVINKKVLAGKPVIKGTRISVDFIMRLLGNGWTYDEILKEYPRLKKTDITAVLKYSADIVHDERVIAIQ
jgi:uncharacterized protein (DUF433 family)